jgi:hypothetical protein
MTALQGIAAQSSTVHPQHLIVTVLSVKPQHLTANQHRSVQHTRSTSQSQCGQSDHSTAAQVSTVQYISTASHNHSVASQTTALHSTAAQVSTVPTPYSTFQSRSVRQQHLTVQKYSSTGQYSNNSTSAQHLPVKVWVVEPQHFTAQQNSSVYYTTLSHNVQ